MESISINGTSSLYYNACTMIKAVRYSALLSLLLVTSVQAAQTTRYHLVKKAVLGGAGGWGYFIYDAPSDRLFISRGTHTMVVDGASLAVVGDIPGTEGVHGVALAPELGRGFTSDGKSSQVTAFDLKTLAVIARYKTGEGPDAILYDASSKRVLTFNGRGRDATALDPATGKVLGTLKLDAKPEFAAADGRGTVFVNLEDKNSLAAIDAATLTLKAVWPLAPCEEPSGLAIDADAHRLFAVCSNKMMAVIDADNGKVLSMPAIGGHPDAAAVDAGRRLAFISNGEGTLTAVQADAPYGVVDTIPTQKGARTLAVDPVGHRVFVVTSEFSDVSSHGRAPSVPGTFTVLVYAPEAAGK